MRTFRLCAGIACFLLGAVYLAIGEARDAGLWMVIAGVWFQLRNLGD